MKPAGYSGTYIASLSHKNATKLMYYWSPGHPSVHSKLLFLAVALPGFNTYVWR